MRTWSALARRWSTSSVRSSSGSGPGRCGCSATWTRRLLLAFLERYPGPSGRAWPGSRPDARVSGARAVLGRAASDRVDGQVRSAPRAGSASSSSPRAGELVLSFVAMIRTLNAQIKQLEGEIRTQVRAHPDGPIFLSLFNSGERDHRRAARRDRRLPRALPRPRRARRRRRSSGRRTRSSANGKCWVPTRVQATPARRVLPW